MGAATAMLMWQVCFFDGEGPPLGADGIAFRGSSVSAIAVLT